MQWGKLILNQHAILHSSTQNPRHTNERFIKGAGWRFPESNALFLIWKHVTFVSSLCSKASVNSPSVSQSHVVRGSCLIFTTMHKTTKASSTPLHSTTKEWIGQKKFKYKHFDKMHFISLYDFKICGLKRRRIAADCFPGIWILGKVSCPLRHV